MSPDELARLANAAHRLREDWPVASLRSLLAEHASKPWRDVAVALTWIATDPNTTTPGRLNLPGPWWTATGRHVGRERPEFTSRPPRRSGALEQIAAEESAAADAVTRARYVAEARAKLGAK